MSHLFADDLGMTGRPSPFRPQLQPAGAFLQQQGATQGFQSPPMLVQRRNDLAPAMTPLGFDARIAQPVYKPTEKSGDAAMPFLSAMRRGLDGFQDSDDDDDDEDEDDEGGYYQPAYSQYHAPTTSFTGRASHTPMVIDDDDDLIFPMEM